MSDRDDEISAVKEGLKRKRDSDGNPKGAYASIENHLYVLEHDSHFKDVRFNIMRGWPEKIVNGRARQWTDTDDSELLAYMESTYGIKSEGNADHAFRIFCKQRQYNPVLEKLSSTPWDGQPHCETFFTRYMGAADTPYSRECSRLFFAGGVNRIRSPGCKYDSVIVLIGAQGGGKSTMCQWLALEPAFYSSTKTISGQKGYEAISGKWIVEIEELLAVLANDHGGQKVEEAAKAFLSTQSDFYRKPYDRRPLDYPRYCVFIGTTNRDVFLTDKTGNRRWFPLRVDSDARFLYEHRAEIQAEIAQAWAEMLAAYDGGKALASPTPDVSLLSVIQAEQRDAEVEDYRVGMMENYLRGKDRVCIVDIWQNCLHDGTKYPPDMLRKDSMEIGAILTNTLRWTRGRAEWFQGYGSQKAFHAPDKANQRR